MWSGRGGRGAVGGGQAGVGWGMSGRWVGVSGRQGVGGGLALELPIWLHHGCVTR